MPFPVARCCGWRRVSSKRGIDASDTSSASQQQHTVTIMPGIQDSQIFLRSWVHQENRIITYRLMSRARNIHVDQAKREMQAYYEANQDNT